MFDKGKKKGTTRFAYQPRNGAVEVAVAGDFSNWQQLPMRRQRGGVFVRHVPTGRGSFEYKFVVDGQWIPDPDNQHLAPDRFGGFNSVASEGTDTVA